MKEKKVINISLSTFFLILAIILIIVMGIFIYKLNNEKNIKAEKIDSLNNEINFLESTVNNLNKEIIRLQSTVNNSNEKNNNVSSTENNDKNQTSENITDSLNGDNVNDSNFQEISGPGYSAILKNNIITITKKFEKSLDLDYNPEYHNKQFTVGGLKGKIKKIVAANMAQSVKPSILILMDDGTVKCCNFVLNSDRTQMIAQDSPNLIDLKNIVDIKVDGDYHYAIDNTGKEIKIWDNEL